MAVLKEAAPQSGCRMCRRYGLECADYPQDAYYQLVPGVGWITGNGSARNGGMPPVKEAITDYMADRRD